MPESVGVKFLGAAPLPEFSRCFVASFLRLTAYDHRRCDALLQQRDVTISGAYADICSKLLVAR
jgi:hypothetical protein